MIVGTEGQMAWKILSIQLAPAVFCTLIPWKLRENFKLLASVWLSQFIHSLRAHHGCTWAKLVAFPTVCTVPFVSFICAPHHPLYGSNIEIRVWSRLISWSVLNYLQFHSYYKALVYRNWNGHYVWCVWPLSLWLPLGVVHPPLDAVFLALSVVTLPCWGNSFPVSVIQLCYNIGPYNALLGGNVKGEGKTVRGFPCLSLSLFLSLPL